VRSKRIKRERERERERERKRERERETEGGRKRENYNLIKNDSNLLKHIAKCKSVKSVNRGRVFRDCDTFPIGGACHPVSANGVALIIAAFTRR